MIAGPVPGEAEDASAGGNGEAPNDTNAEYLQASYLARGRGRRPTTRSSHGRVTA